MNKAILLLLACCFSLFATAQSYHELRGQLLDSTGAPLPNASVLLLSTPDSLLEQFATSNNMGHFRIKDAPQGNWILQVSFVGFKTFNKSLNLGTGNEPIDLGVLQLEEDKVLLGEFEVEGEQVPIRIKGDTVEYNAGSFKTQPNDVVEDLLDQLPGIEVQKDGSIKAMGEDVDKVLVDGKEFFGNDPKIATKNLPADAIDKVQLFDKQSEMAEFTGIDDGERDKTINLQLKEDKKLGYFGNVTGGYGTDNRYKGKFNINRFNKKAQISAIGMANNINEQGFSFQDYMNLMGGFDQMMANGSFDLSNTGIPLDVGRNNGLVTTTAGGINFNYDFSPKTEWRSSYFYNRLENNIERESLRQNFTDDGVYTTNENSNSTTQNDNHRLNFRLKHKIDTVQDITLKGNVGYNEGLSMSHSETQNLDVNNELTNSGISNNRSNLNRLNTQSNLIYRRRLGKPGRTLVTDFSFGLNNNEQTSRVDAVNRFVIDTLNNLAIDTLLQNQDQTSEQFNYGVNAAYTEPLGNGKFLQLNYARNQYTRELRKNFYNLEDAAALAELNTDLSTAYTNTYAYDRGVLNFRLNRKKTSLLLGVGVQYSTLQGKVLTNNVAIQRTFLNALPRLHWSRDFSSSSRMHFRYETNVGEPSMEQLQPVVDNSDPLNIYVGNPGLDAEFRHNLNFNYMFYSQFSNTGFFVSLGSTYTENKITNAVTIDSLLAQTTQPVNTNSETLLNTYIGFNRPLFRKAKINIETNSTYIRGITFVNSLPNNTDRWINSVDFSIENRKRGAVNVAVGTRYALNHTAYSISSELNQQFTTSLYYADLDIDFLKKWSLGSSMDYTIYAGDAFDTNQEIPIWKAHLSRKLLNNDRGLLKVTVFDILDENRGFNRTSQLNYLQEDRTNALGRYVMVTFTYNLSRFGKKESITIDEGRR